MSRYAVHIIHEHGASVHVGIVDGRAAWTSAMPADVPDEIRLNLDHPTATRAGETIRYRFPFAEEARRLGIDEDRHRYLAAHAAARFLVDGGEAATIVGLDRSAVDQAGGVLLEGVAVGGDEAIEAAEAEAAALVTGRRT